MICLTLRTDNPKAYIGLWNNNKLLAEYQWHADRQLAETLHMQVMSLLSTNDMSLTDINGIVVFQGPGSFTGLRIGISAANALAYAITCPIVGSQNKKDDDWQQNGIERLQNDENDIQVIPLYGSEPNITVQKK